MSTCCHKIKSRWIKINNNKNRNKSKYRKRMQSKECCCARSGEKTYDCVSRWTLPSACCSCKQQQTKCTHTHTQTITLLHLTCTIEWRRTTTGECAVNFGLSLRQLGGRVVKALTLLRRGWMHRSSSNLMCTYVCVRVCLWGGCALEAKQLQIRINASLVQKQKPQVVAAGAATTGNANLEECNRILYYFIILLFIFFVVINLLVVFVVVFLLIKLFCMPPSCCCFMHLSFIASFFAKSAASHTYYMHMRTSVCVCVYGFVLMCIFGRLFACAWK